MDTEFLANPADPVADDDSYAGYAKIARELSKQHPERPRPFSRQLVERWYKRSYYNGFPQPHQVRTKSGLIRRKFKLDEVQRWHDSYRPHQMGITPDDEGMTIDEALSIDQPRLFEIDVVGIPSR